MCENAVISDVREEIIRLCEDIAGVEGTRQLFKVVHGLFHTALTFVLLRRRCEAGWTVNSSSCKGLELWCLVQHV
jgi:hypothetical protein